MKKLLILSILSILWIAPIFGQLEVLPKAGIEYAFGRSGFDFISYDPMASHYPYAYDFGDYRAKTAIEFRYKRFSAEFDNHVYMYKGRDYMFQPTRIDFHVDVRYNITNKISFGVGHLCMHPIQTAGAYMQEFSGGYSIVGISYGY